MNNQEALKILGIFVAIIIIIIVIKCNQNKENFCSSCTGPILHYYQYGDPFYKYMHDQRRKYQRYPENQKWMNT